MRISKPHSRFMLTYSGELITSTGNSKLKQPPWIIINSRPERKASLFESFLRGLVNEALTVTFSKFSRGLIADSSAVQQWTQSANEQLVFITNRIEEILELNSFHQWSHISTVDNPADSLNRSVAFKSLSQTSCLKDPLFFQKLDFGFKTGSGSIP